METKLDGGQLVAPEHGFWHGDELFCNGKPVWCCSVVELACFAYELRGHLRKLDELYSAEMASTTQERDSCLGAASKLIEALMETLTDRDAQLAELRAQKEEA